MNTLPIHFYKFHGLGNDFIAFDGLQQELPLNQLCRPELVSRLCNRNFGIGADGLLFVLPPSSSAAQARMRIINADGSEAEMCGNGIRCIAKLLYDHSQTIKGRQDLLIETGAGPLDCHLTIDATGTVASVRVNMGRPVLERSQIPMRGAGQFIDQELSIGGTNLRATAVSMGNPHLVIFIDDDQPLQTLAEKLGPRLEYHPDFPNRTNVEFARYRSQISEIELVVWERSCGITLACGTGACATAVASVITGRHQEEKPVFVRLPGGSLLITVDKNLEKVWMDGPATEVFQGQLRLSEWA